MAVVGSAKRVRSGWSAVQKWGGNIDFTCHYQVQSDDPDDGPQVIAAATGIPLLGSTYVFGNDSDPFAFAKSIHPNRRGTSLLWDVTVVFGPQENEEDEGQPVGRNENGDPVDDPLEEAPSITVRPLFMTKAVEKAWYRGVVEGGALDRRALGLGRPVDSIGAVVNSVMVPFDPPLESDYFRTSINISVNFQDFNQDQFKTFVNTVNAAQITVNRVGFQLTLAPFTGKITNINGTRRSRNGKIFWQGDLELQVDDVFTWRVDVLDRGYVGRACDGDPNGEGGNWDDYTDPPKDGRAQVQVIRDRNGDPITEPVRLDGKGQPLKCNDADIFIRYSVYPELNWLPLNAWLNR